jgi:two-component system, NarL family, sensor histidine kinase UhpB
LTGLVAEIDRQLELRSTLLRRRSLKTAGEGIDSPRSVANSALHGAAPRPAILGYTVALLAVGAAVLLLAVLQTHWRSVPHVSVLLVAVIVTTRLSGPRPGLAAMALAILGFAYLLSLTASPLAPSLVLLRLVPLAGISLYVVWITATERARAEAVTRAHAEAQQNNQALRAENLERRRTEEALRISEAKFRALAESAPAGIFIFDGERVSYANPAASVITGYSCEELPGMSFRDVVHPDFIDLISSAWQPPKPGEPDPLRHEVKIIAKTGEERWLDATKARLEIAGRPAVVCIASNITERKQTEEALRDSQQLLDQVLATLPVGLVVTDRKGDIVLANAALTRIWGEMPGKRAADRYSRSKGWWHHSGKRLEPSEWASRRALSHGETSVNELIDIEGFTGEHKTIQNSAAPVRNADDQIVGCVIVNEDVTERVRAEEALKDSAYRLQHLSRRLLAVQEEERRHLARELHDEFGQLLATVTLHLQAAKAAAGPEARPNLDESLALLQRAGTRVRSLALELRPVLLETAGLDATLRWLAQQHGQRTGIVTEVIGHVTEVPGEVAIACFRVLQEALTNVVRHAEARNVRIELTHSEGRLSLVVRDDGVGFDVSRILERAAGGANLGLVGMRERVEILGGNLTISAQPGHGTAIQVSFPLPDTGTARAPDIA